MTGLDGFKRKLLPLRQQADITNRWLLHRLDTVLPEIMRREGIDMWLVVAREYNEDPVIMTLLPEPQMSARRRTILVFHIDDDDNYERFTLSRYGLTGFYETGWNPDEESQFECLKRVVTERDPKVIGLNISETTAFGDGLSHNEYTEIANALGDDLMSRVKPADRLCVGWLERRIAPEIVAYPALVEIGHAIIAEMFSTTVIHAGITTTDDLVWWMRQTMHEMGLQAWFQPSMEIQAKGQAYDDENPRTLIMHGDLLHCDVGFYYLGLATDQQQHAYVLKPNESDAPEGLKLALADANRLQDIHLEEMKIGLSGDQILRNVRERAIDAGINPQVYTHALGYHGHAAGMIIGMWDMQGGVAGLGAYELFDNTCYSVELNAKRNVPEWDNQEVRIALEEDAVLQNGEMRWLHGRQTKLHLIG